MKTSNSISKRHHRAKGGLAVTIVAFFLGIIFGIGGLIGGIALFLANVKLKDGISMVGNAVGVSDVDYSEYLSEEYAQKTVFDAIGSISSVIGKGEELTISDLQGISPAIGTQVNNLVSELKNSLGIELTFEGDDGLANLHISKYGEYFSDAIFSTQLGTLLSSSSINALTPDNTNYDLFMLLSYGEKENYTIDEDGNVVMNEGKTATTLGSLMGFDESEGITGLFNNVTLVSLIEALGSEVIETPITNVLFYAKDEETDETTPRTIGEFMSLMGENDLFSTLKLSDLIEIDDETSPAFLVALKDKTISDLTKPETLNSLKIGDIVKTDENSPQVLKALASKTLADLNDKEVINNLTIADIMGRVENENDSPILYIIQDLTINDVSDTNQNLLVKKINELKIKHILDEEVLDGNFLLKCLSKDTKIGEFPSAIANLTVNKIFENEINTNATWKYMLKDENGNISTVKLSEVGSMVTNMTRNIQKATLNDLVNDGIISVQKDGDGKTFCDNDILYEVKSGMITIGSVPTRYYKADGSLKTKLGELTISEILNYVGEIISILG